MLQSVGWYLVNDVSGHPIGPIFKGQEVKEEFLLGCGGRLKYHAGKFHDVISDC